MSAAQVLGTVVRASDLEESLAVTQPPWWRPAKKTVVSEVCVTKEEVLWVLWERAILGTLKQGV